MKQITKRNHYNPCFWTAFWNCDYYENFLNNSSKVLDHREQVVYVLNIKSNSIYTNKVENVHVEKKIGLAKITFEAAKRFYKRYYPDKYEAFCRDTKADKYPLYLNFESILTGLEKTIPYQVLLNVIKRQNIASDAEHAFLTDFIWLQYLRSHAVMNATIEQSSKQGIEKFEYFVLLKWGLSNPEYSYAPVYRLGTSQWTLYRTTEDKFPLTDSPILVEPGSIMVALSPRLLVEISLDVPAKKSGWRINKSINKEKLAEFQRRTINNTFREIIFSEGTLLTQWQKSSMI